jgi:metal-dependent amidase/aminoacylase/carboxypeptidase family protein
MSDAQRQKQRAAETIRAQADRWRGLGRRIHAAPELGYDEHRASGWVADELEVSGFGVSRGACGLPTALVAERGAGPLRIGLCAEYDALPGIGHACGHNLIAAAAVAAAAGLGEVAGELGLSVRVLGTPAEEVGNGGG